MTVATLADVVGDVAGGVAALAVGVGAVVAVGVGVFRRAFLASSSRRPAVLSRRSAILLGSKLIGNLVYAGLIREASSLPCAASCSKLSALAAGLPSLSSLTGLKKPAISSANPTLTAFLTSLSPKSIQSRGLLAISKTKLPAVHPTPCNVSPKSTPPVDMRLKNTSGLFQSGSLNV